MTQFGPFIRERRLYRFCGQKELAKLCGISAQYLGDIERGNRPPPSDEVIVQLAHWLGIGEDMLFYAAGRIPLGLRGKPIEVVRPALWAFRQAIREATS